MPVPQGERGQMSAPLLLCGPSSAKRGKVTIRMENRQKEYRSARAGGYAASTNSHNYANTHSLCSALEQKGAHTKNLPHPHTKTNSKRSILICTRINLLHHVNYDSVSHGFWCSHSPITDKADFPFFEISQIFALPKTHISCGTKPQFAPQFTDGVFYRQTGSFYDNLKKDS